MENVGASTLTLEAMGGETGRESSGPIRRFPTGFWASFNLWWHGEYARLGQRPSSKAIIKWHAENATKVWGDNAVSYQETQRHANRMKCRRTGQQLQRHVSLDEDEEDEDCCPDVLPSDGGEGGGTVKISCGGNLPSSGTDQPSGVDGSSGGKSPVKAPPLPAPSRVKFDAHSDPPGALTTGYMNADSDVPAPAAPTASFTNCFVSRQPDTKPMWMQPDTKPMWMQPDPTVVPGAAPGMGGFSQGGNGEAHGIWSPSWDSSSILGRQGGDQTGEAMVERCSGSSQDMGMGYHLMEAGSRAAKRGRDGGPVTTRPNLFQVPAAVRLGAEQLHQPEPQQRPPLPPRANPFAEVAAAAAAAAGLPAVNRALPAARNAAELLGSAALAASRPFQRCSPRFEPMWLQRTGAELNALMREIGLLATGANVAASLSGVAGRSRVLCSTRPLRLPEPSPRRDLDIILRRRLQHGGDPSSSQSAPATAVVVTATVGNITAASPASACPRRAIGNVVLDRDLREPLLLLRGRSSAGDPSQGGPPHGAMWVQSASETRVGGSTGLMAIDNLPLEALL